MSERIRGRLEQLGRFFKREKRIEPEIPSYINDDYDLLGHLDPPLHNELNRSSFQHLQTTLQSSETFDDVVDIGASRNVLRGVAFLNTAKITAIDPAYRWYDYEMKDPFTQTPYPNGVFGGKIERKEMEKLLAYACRALEIPATMNQDRATLT